MRSKVIRFVRMPLRQKWMLAEAYYYLAWARVLKSRPFSTVAPRLGVQMKETPLSVEPGQLAELKQVAQVIRLMSRYTLWESQCLVRAMAGMKMLERRKIASTLYLGTARDGEGRLIAHAWLRSGPIIVTGGEEMPAFTTVAIFGKTTDERN
jgi:hypothetical protein